MLTICDVLDLCGDETKLREWLKSYGVLREPPSDCSKCGPSLKASVYSGKPSLVCSNQKCRKSVYAVVGGLLEGSKLSLKVNGQRTRREVVRGAQRVVSTNGIDGTWGRLKTWLRAKGGVPDGLLLGYIKEFQWRANLDKDQDPFIALLECIRADIFRELILYFLQGFRERCILLRIQ